MYLYLLNFHPMLLRTSSELANSRSLNLFVCLESAVNDHECPQVDVIESDVRFY